MAKPVHKIPDIVEKDSVSGRRRRLATRLRGYGGHSNLTVVNLTTNLRGQANLVAEGLAEVAAPSPPSMVTDELIDKWLMDAVEECEDIEIADLPKGVVDETRRIMQALRGLLPSNTDVYLIEGEGIAVEVFGETGFAYLLICELNGEVRCFVTANGIARSAHYKSSKRLPDGFLQEGLEQVQASFAYMHLAL